jgi:hypothetical protein
MLLAFLRSALSLPELCSRLLHRLGVTLGCSERGLRLLKPFTEIVGPLVFVGQRPLGPLSCAIGLGASGLEIAATGFDLSA